MSRTILSIYCDDTSPFTSPPGAFKTFLDFISAEGIAGESSVIIGYDWASRQRLLSEPATEIERDYLAQLDRVEWLRPSECAAQVYGRK